MVIVLRRGADAWTPHSVIRFDVSGENVARIVDYIRCRGCFRLQAPSPSLKRKVVADGRSRCRNGSGRVHATFLVASME